MKNNHKITDEKIKYPSDSKGEIILYQPDKSLKLEVRVEDETVWLNRQQIAQLFDRDVKTIGKHINNALNEELLGFPTIANFATVQIEGNRIVERYIDYYNLDMILSIGYRVKSQKGIQLRTWSNRILKDYLLKGYAINQRIERVEKFAIKIFTRSHDRFLFIDDDVYHIGASLKDLGKKWFAFSKMGLNTNILLQNII